MVISNFASFSCTNPFVFEVDLRNFNRDKKLKIRLHILENMVTLNKNRQEQNLTLFERVMVVSNFASFSCSNPFGFEGDL